MDIIEVTEPTEIKYVCRKCAAEDHESGVYPPAPLVLNCWNCGAGRGLSLQEMVSQGIGMVRVSEVVNQLDDFNPATDLGGKHEPKAVVVGGAQYDYKRFVLRKHGIIWEVLECQTCRAYFVTKVLSGIGTLMAEKEDHELCPGCAKLCGAVDIIEDDPKKSN